MGQANKHLLNKQTKFTNNKTTIKTTSIQKLNQNSDRQPWAIKNYVPFKQSMS